MSELYERVVRHVEHTPPACLGGFRLSSPNITTGEWCAAGVGWQLTCECGGNQGKALGYSLKDYDAEYDGPEFFVSPLAFQCSACGKVTEVLDTSIHGYDGENAKRFGTKNTKSIRGSGERKPFPCPQCQKTFFAVTAYFGHSHFDHIEDEPELEPRSQDFFDTFSFCGTCKACGEKSTIANYELA